MQRRGMFTFVVLNIVISAAVAFGIISLLGGGEQSSTGGGTVLVTFEVIITTTPDPNAPVQIVVVTATPDNAPERANIPNEARDNVTSVALAGSPAAATLPGSTPGIPAATLAPDAPLPAGCIQHTLVEGEFPSSLAFEYDVSVFDILAVNRLTEEDSAFLQIGDVLIIPLEGCPIELFADTPTPTVPPTATPTDTGTPGPSPTPLPDFTATPTIDPNFRPTVTLAPTAADAQVEIVGITGAGDITTEQIAIVNNGETVSIGGWTLSDGQGNSYTFPQDKRLFSGGGVFVNTRAGDDTPILLFWGQDRAVFEPGDVVVLQDAEGEVQASLRIP